VVRGQPGKSEGGTRGDITSEWTGVRGGAVRAFLRGMR
jgi:hypothetical protein